MKITEHFKAQLILAQKMGHTHVYSVCGAYKATTYVWIWTIAELLAMPCGETTGGRPRICRNMWHGWPNTRNLDARHISYTAVMKLGNGK